MTDNKKFIKEGDLYKVLIVEGETFEIRYGYYEDYERERWDPGPIYPDFVENPIYTEEGYPFVTRIQDACEHYIPQVEESSEKWCASCVYLKKGQEDIGICTNKKRRRQKIIS